MPCAENREKRGRLVSDETPELVGKIVRSLVESQKKPVTIKFRKGFDEEHINAVEIAKIAEANGASAVAVHGRTREQYYSGKADWDIIKEVKAAVQIPVIGNGDIFTPQDAKNLLEHTGCDAIMVGRGAQGNPWIFKRILHYLKTGGASARTDRTGARREGTAPFSDADCL